PESQWAVTFGGMVVPKMDSPGMCVMPGASSMGTAPNPASCTTGAVGGTTAPVPLRSRDPKGNQTCWEGEKYSKVCLKARIVNGDAVRFLMSSAIERYSRNMPVLVTCDVNATGSPGTATVLSLISVAARLTVMRLPRTASVTFTPQAPVPGEQLPFWQVSPV